MTERKYIDIKEFRERGYLQELNRCFLHPLGLALEIKIGEDGEESLGNIWDYRKDLEGIYYDLENSSQGRKDVFKTKRDFIVNELKIRNKARVQVLGFDIEPIE